MKITLCSLLLIVAPFFCLAQTTKGSFMIGGTFNFSYEDSYYGEPGSNDPNLKYSEEDVTAYQVNPMGGYFLLNNLAIGCTKLS